MSGPIQKGRWEISEPGYYRDEYQSQHNPSIGLYQGWYRRWIPPKYKWVGPKPRAYWVGLCMIYVTFVLLAVSIPLTILVSSVDDGVLFICLLAVLAFLITGVAMLRRYD